MAVPVIAPSPPSELSVLTPSWERALRAENKSPHTIVGYLEGIALLDAYLRAKGCRPTSRIFGASTSMRSSSLRSNGGVRRPRALGSEASSSSSGGASARASSARVRPQHDPPAIPEEPPAVLTEDQLRRLLKACEGPYFLERRDMAVVLLFIDTGMHTADFALDGGVAYREIR